MLRLFLIFIMLCLPVFGSDYGVYSPENYKFNDNESEKILFIMDFSNSMSEYLDGQRKVNLMIETMKSILPRINPDTIAGLRVYGHKSGFTAMDACKASSLLVPLGTSNTYSIAENLSRTKPRGMTPITYSLKQAVKYDFLGFSGKKRIILLTDGGENCDESPCTYAMELVKTRKDINIDVIAFNVHDDEDLAQLKCTADVTGGRFTQAETKAQLFRSMENFTIPHTQKDVEATIFSTN